MVRQTILLAMILLGVASTALAWKHDPDKHGASESVKVLASRDIGEKLDGKETKATAVEVTLEPGQAGAPHRHPGPAFVYVIEGTYELGIDDKPTQMFKAGETFYEPSGCLHRVSKNPSDKTKTRLIAWLLHPRDATEIVIPEEHPR